MKHKIVSFILAIMMILSLGITAFASESPDYYSMENESLSEITGITIEELAEAREMYDIETFNKVIEHYLDSIVSVDYDMLKSQPLVLENGETGETIILKSRISDSSWNHISGGFVKGQILITYEGSRFGYNHGHAGILYNTTETIEHRGKNYGNGLSGKYSVDWWKSTYTAMKTLNYSDRTIMTQSANYAYNNLRGLEYNVIAARNSNKVNCATLVWKAYNNYGVNIVDDTGYAYIAPMDIDESSKLIMVRSVGWANVDWEW